MPPSFQFSWCWGSQLKPPSQECSLLAPQQGAVAPVEMSLEERGEALYSQQKQDQELTVAQVMNSLLPNSD